MSLTHRRLLTANRDMSLTHRWLLTAYRDMSLTHRRLHTANRDMSLTHRQLDAAYRQKETTLTHRQLQTACSGETHKGAQGRHSPPPPRSDGCTGQWAGSTPEHGSPRVGLRSHSATQWEGVGDFVSVTT